MQFFPKRVVEILKSGHFPVRLHSIVQMIRHYDLNDPFSHMFRHFLPLIAILT